jgi:mono/diheme cytochrome c family protein
MTSKSESIPRPAWLAFLALAGVLIAATFAGGCRASEASGAAAPASASVQGADTAQAAILERGHYLVTVGGCHDCHTPWHVGPNGPEPDMSRMLSGHPQEALVDVPPNPAGGPWIISAYATNTAWAGPWGVSFTANLTPDENTGIGIWTEEIFINTLRSGKHWGQSRDILPPMPWFNYGKMTDEDLRAVYAVSALDPAGPEPGPGTACPGDDGVCRMSRTGRPPCRPASRRPGAPALRRLRSPP